MLKFLTLCVSVLLIFCSEVAAQPETRDQFFPRDFVNGGGLQLPNQLKPTATISTETHSVPHSIPAQPTVVATQGRVVSLGLIVEARDARSFELAIAKLLEIAERYEYGITKIFTLGRLQKPLDRTNLLKITARGGEMVEIFELPPAYAMIKRSPTWIARTASGEYLIEGIIDPSRFFTAEGALAIPEQ
jgi:hypothetical protein